jgi:hypothetical protein
MITSGGIGNRRTPDIGAGGQARRRRINPTCPLAMIADAKCGEGCPLARRTAKRSTDSLNSPYRLMRRTTAQNRPLVDKRNNIHNPHTRLRKWEYDYASISLERDYTLPHYPVDRPSRGSASSWRDTPPSTVSLTVLGAVLLVCLGLLLGATWTTHTSQSMLRRQAEERRRLNEEWMAVHTERGRCPHCANPLSEYDWFVAPTQVEYRPDGD